MFPVLGFLMRKGRCRYCGAPIPGDSLASEVIFGMAGIVVVQGITAAAIPTLYRATLFLIGAGSIAGYIAKKSIEQSTNRKASLSSEDFTRKRIYPCFRISSSELTGH